MAIKKFKGIIFFIMVMFSLSMLSIGNKGSYINENTTVWVLFGLINFIYWSFKCIKTALGICLNEDDVFSFTSSNKKISNPYRNATGNTYDNGETINTSYDSDYHSKYMPREQVISKVNVAICESMKPQSGIEVISLEETSKKSKK